MRASIVKILLSSIFVISLISCKDDEDNNNDNVTPTPTITGLYPSSGGEGIAVKIVGQNFGLIDTDNIVDFNGAIATLESTSATELVAIVPAGATAGNVTITVKGKKVIGPVFSFSPGQAVEVSTLAGSKETGYQDATGTAARFNYPIGMSVDAGGNIYVADIFNNRIRKITPTGQVSTVAGTGAQGSVDGNAASATFNHPTGVAVDASGNIYVTDIGNSRIRKITAAGVVSTLAGTEYGYLDATGTAAKFNEPYGLAVDNSGNVYVADRANHKIRKITPGGVVTTLAGSSAGFVDGNGTSAKFDNPFAVATDANDNVYVADAHNQAIRKITPSGTVSTLAGTGDQGYRNGVGINAAFNFPRSLAADSNGNVYVADEQNFRIRKITSAGEVTTLAGLGYRGDTNGNGSVALLEPTAVAVSATGIVYVSEAQSGGGQRIRKISLQ